MTIRRLLQIFFWLLVIVIPVCLGTWQLQRLAWKTQLLHNLDLAYRVDPERVKLTVSELFPLRVDDTVFYRGLLTGVVDDRYSILVGPRQRDGQVGYFWYSLMTIRGGAGVWIERGFVPNGFIPSALGVHPVKVTGLLHQPTYAGVVRKLTPGNNNDFDAWWPMAGRFTAATLRAAKEDKSLYEISPLVFRTEQPIAENDGAVPDMQKPTFRNAHFNYALFWFAMSWLAVIVGVLSIRRGGSTNQQGG